MFKKLKIKYLKEFKPEVCNLSYSGGRDQEDRGSKPAQANSA
jgi:hypothetical protein